MDLILPLKSIYFDAIEAGTKLEENRLCTDYWKRRLVGHAIGGWSGFHMRGW